MEFKFNVPNRITLIRIALVPLFAVVLLAKIPHKNIFSAIIFVLLSVSDFFDGYIARKKKQVTDFGKLIDPIADKLLISTALIFLVIRGLDLWIAVVIISREMILTAIRIYLLPSKLVVPAGNIGKLKTVFQSIGIVFVLLDLKAGYYLMLIAVFLTVVSGIDYIIKIRKLTGYKVVNIPNLITITRLLLIFPFAYYIENSKHLIALIIFSVITLSDKLDGISARLMDQKTELGSGLDSFTDWTVIIVSFSLLFLQGFINKSWVVLIVIPPLVSGAMKMFYARKKKTVPVTLIARLSVALTYTTLIIILLKITFHIEFFEIVTDYLLKAILVMVYATMAVYVFKAWSIKHKIG